MTVNDVAEMLEVTPQYIRKLCIDGRLKGTKIGHQWLFTPEAVEEFKKTRRSPGRPKKEE